MITANRWRDTALVLGGAFVGATGLAWVLAVVVAAALGASFVWFGTRAGPGQDDADPVPEPAGQRRTRGRAGMN